MLGWTRPDPPRPPSGLDCAIAVGGLVVLVSLGFYLFGDGASYGPNQIALVLAATVAGGIAWKNGHSWHSVREAVVAGISSALPAVFILGAVGALIGTWAMSGTLVAMVYYALGILSPHYFYLSACIVCALVALSIGSSWTVAGTIGVGLMGVAAQMGLSPYITAGAVISGAYFGDKASPLSDTTNLAAASAGAELFAHIRASVVTSGPALAIALILFGLLGEPHDFDASATQAAIAGSFQVTPWAFLPLVVVLVLSFLKAPAFNAIIAGAVTGGIMAVILVPDLVLHLADAPDLPRALGLLKGVWTALASGFHYKSADPALDQLLTRGGMESMLNTVWLILAALAYGSVLEHGGILQRLVQPLLGAARSAFGLVGTVVGTCVGANLITGDQYIAIVLPGRMFKAEFAERRLPPILLSRTLGDSATVTSALVPWNSCGAYMAATLGVATQDYLPYAFLNIFNPVVTILVAFLFWRRASPPAVAAPAQA
ncbi:MAG: Na+/H+ antiporter NhaC family protein [Geminicoccaceae bacterium]